MKHEEVHFTVRGLPPTSNHALLQARGGRRYPSEEYKKWKELVKALPNKKIDESEWYECGRVYYFPLYYKNGKIRKKDHTNLNKYADDELCKKLGIDDSHIKTSHDDKQDCKEGEERTEWTIWVVG